MYKQPSEFLVTNEKAQTDVKFMLAKAWRRKGPLTHNPAPNPVSLLRHNLSTLVEEEYVVAEKSDGVRYVLILMTLGSRQKVSVLVDRTLTIYQIQIFAPSHLFKGSVFDTELVWDTKLKKKKLLVFDVMLVAGVQKGRANLTDRYKIISDVFLSSAESPPDDHGAHALAQKGKICCVSADNMFVQYKPMLPFKLMGSVHRSKHLLTHESDGFIFTSVQAPVECFTNHQCFKWKSQPTIDFGVSRNTDGKFDLFCLVGNGELQSLDHAFPQKKFFLGADSVFILPDKELSIIEVSVSSVPKNEAQIKCCFLRFRPDKNSPNHCNTVAAVVREVVENITIQELITLAERNQEVTTAVSGVETSM